MRTGSPGLRRQGAERPGSGGFTLLELMFVITLILILASFAMPTFRVAVLHACEAVLSDDLFTLRKLIMEACLSRGRF